MWQYRGRSRPRFAIEPGPGQESVWDYPRPPDIRADRRRVVVRHRGQVIADSTGAVRVCETASPPTFYLPATDVRLDLLERADGQSFCEWKGVASYWDCVVDGDKVANAAWSYPEPRPAFRGIAGYFSFYPGRLECHVDGERVRPQPGGFYGGWLTDEIVGPVKGEPGTAHW